MKDRFGRKASLAKTVFRASTFGPSMGVPLFFDVSGGELMLILLFVLLFFGSKGIPGIARTLGRTMRQIRDASAEVQREIQKGASEMKQGVDQQRRVFNFDDPPAAPARTDPEPPASAPEPPAPEPGK